LAHGPKEGSSVFRYSERVNEKEGLFGLIRADDRDHFVPVSRDVLHGLSSGLGTRVESRWPPTPTPVSGFTNPLYMEKGDLSALYPDLRQLRETDMLKESIRNTGAVVMGRRAYDVARGDLTGYEYQTPIYVVTHQPPKTAPKGQNARLRVHFVPQGVEEAIRLAKTAANGKDVTIIGGAETLRQALSAHLVNELQIGIAPVFLGSGLRLFETMDELNLKPELDRVRESPGRVDLFYRISR